MTIYFSLPFASLAFSPYQFKRRKFSTRNARPNFGRSSRELSSRTTGTSYNQIEMSIFAITLLATLAGLVASQSLVIIGGSLDDDNAIIYDKMVELAVRGI